MKTTKTLAILPLAFGAALATSTVANAQAMSFTGIDTNSDGMLAATELEAAFGANAQLALEQYDLNGDGMVEVEEATKVSSRGSIASEGGMSNDTEMMTETTTDVPSDLLTEEEAANMQAETGASATVGVEMSGS